MLSLTEALVDFDIGPGRRIEMPTKTIAEPVGRPEAEAKSALNVGGFGANTVRLVRAASIPQRDRRVGTRLLIEPR
ncbi:hypothetical protein DSM104635_00143 [Terricaulis silvestris]|uniref:Uncharacterized protein n=1 Tax=Terricaulis silvestris TaxID=2686094 RepID=A0A6I6MQA0_9CAUL|nr:hypothetical protein DSM104635_00143 [Terricaulis silvestris]